MTESPLLSYVIPARNAAATIREAVDSVLDQRWESLEVVVVDDGSTDGTVDRLPKDPRIRVERIDPAGLGAARDRGHQLARGDLVAWMDADDIAHPDRSRIQVEVMRRHPDVVAVSSDFTSFDEAGERGETARSTYGRLMQSGSAVEEVYGPGASHETAAGSHTVHVADVSDELPFGNFVHPPTLMVRREAAIRVPPPPVDLPISTDWLFFCRLSRVGRFAFVDAPLLRYRRWAGQISDMTAHASRIALDSSRAFDLILEERPELFEQHPDRVRRMRGERGLQLGSALAGERGLGALPVLLASARLIGPGRSHLRSALRAVTPLPLLRLTRRLRGLPGS